MQRTAEAEQKPSDDEDREWLTYKHVSDFLRLKDGALDQMPPEVIISINPHAPIRKIIGAVEKNVREVKERLGLQERRTRESKMPEYLKVWDLREGWTGEDYGRPEMKFSEIRREISIRPSTAVNQYRAAFRLIVGHDYDPLTWIRVFDAYKKSPVTNSQAVPLRPRRDPLRTEPDEEVAGESSRLGDASSPGESSQSKEPNEILETDLSPQDSSGHRGSLLENESVQSDELGDLELLMDVRSLIERRWSDEQIINELGLNPEAASGLIQEYRERFDDGL